MLKYINFFNFRYSLYFFTLVSVSGFGLVTINNDAFDYKNTKIVYDLDVCDDTNVLDYNLDICNDTNEVDYNLDACNDINEVDYYSAINYDTDIYETDNYDLIDYNSYESSLNNTKNYSGMALDNEFEDDIKMISDEYNIPYQVVLTIGERESGGSWNNNGIISSTNDYGVFQINECNLSYIEDKLGYTKEEILYDSVKNAEACVFLLNDIISRDDVTTLDDIFGMYNGWVNWEKKSQSVNYVNACLEIVDEYFPDYQYSLIKK